MDKDLRIASLEARVDNLQARIEDLEGAMFGGFTAPLVWQFTPNEERIFAVLLGRPMATKEALMVALYDDVLIDRVEIKIVDVFICKMRRKLKKMGVNVKIETVWGRGYRLSDADRTRLRSAA